MVAIPAAVAAPPEVIAPENSAVVPVVAPVEVTPTAVTVLAY